ncbi:MAG TPA: hypothetical protein VHS78_05350 [Candidatus Elarobacter sp.]|jgi:hypothetical protein|nr:hypothetical protein [Candidatus Elarobacter sp.]
MPHRAISALGAFVLAVSLAACGGGSSGGGGFVGPPNPPGPGSISISPSSLSFSGPGAASQTFTVSSTLGNVAAPQFDTFGCGPVVQISPSSSTLPATYTVTPLANGTCSLVANLGHASASIGITVGGSAPSFNASTSTVTLYVGGTAGNVLVGASSGAFTADTTACAGIASVTPNAFAGSSTYNQSFSIAPVSAGSCQLTLVNGSASVVVTVNVNPGPGGPNALVLSPSSMDFASTGAAPQQGTLNFTGNVGQVSIDENDCTGGTGKPKIAYLTLNGVPPGSPVTLPQSFTITLYGNATGTCQINFVPQTGSAATLTITVH